MTPWTAACQASLSITNSRSLLRLMSIKWVMPSNHLILCRPLLCLPSIFPSIRVFSLESVFCIRWPNCCRKGYPFQGLKLGSCLTLGNELSKETYVLTKQEILLGKGPRGGEQEGKGTQENCSAAWIAVLGFMMMGLVSRLSLANHSNSESFLVAHASLSPDGC